MFNRTNIIRFFIIALLPIFSFSKVYYISNLGDDSNSGESADEPWETISKVNSMAFNAGDTILFQGGQSFDGNLYFDADDGNDNSNPIIISSYGNGKAIINAGNSYGLFILNSEGFNIENIVFMGANPNTNSSNGIYLLNDLTDDKKLNNFKIINCEISGFVNGISIESSNGNSGYDSIDIESSSIHNCLDNGIRSLGFFSTEKTGYSHSNIQVTQCEVYDIFGFDDPNSHTGNGIVLSNVQNSLIENCTVYNCGVYNTHCGGPIGIWFWDSDQVIIQFCEAYNISAGTGCDGGGFDLDGGVTNGVMQYNYSHDNDGSGFLVGQFIGSRPMDNIIVRYNISENDAKTNGGSIALFNLGSTSMDNILCYNNTLFSNNSLPNIYIYNFNSINGNIKFYNNILYANGGADLLSVPAGSSAFFGGNLYFSPEGFNIDYQGTNYGSLNDFRITDNELLEGSEYGYQGNPLLLNAGNGGTIGHNNSLSNLMAYQLTKSSPAIDAGVEINSNDFQDFYGNNPVINGTRDIGAHEYSSTLGDVVEVPQEKLLKVFTDQGNSRLIIISDDLTILKAQLIDINGRIIAEFEQRNDSALKNINFNITNLEQGIYLLKIKTVNQLLTKKVVIDQRY